MADMIGLLRFGMPAAATAQVVPPSEPLAGKSPAVTAVQSGSGGAQANANYTALPRPIISPHFAQANVGDAPGSAEHPASSAVLKIPEPFDIHIVPGPPPTFEATLLQLEAHLRLSLARIDATRTAQAMDPKPPAEPGDAKQPGLTKPDQRGNTGTPAGPDAAMADGRATALPGSHPLPDSAALPAKGPPGTGSPPTGAPTATPPPEGKAA